MKTIILCGGRGTRLNEQTEFRPKPLVMVGDKPILWHIMKIYKSHGFNSFILALGYKGQMIIDWFKDNKEFNIEFVDTGEDTLVGERILRCKDYVDDNFMVTYGDGVSNINIKKLTEYHLEHKRLGTLTGVKPYSKYGLLIINRDNEIVDFEEKPQLNDYINGGFMVFKKEIFSYMKTKEMEHPTLQRLSSMRELIVFKHDDFWYAVDTQKELDELNKMWSNNPEWKIW